MPASTSSTTLQLAVGTPAASMTSLANAFEPSSRAAAALGPNAAMPARGELVGEPRDERRLGPDDDEIAARVLRGVDEPVDVVDGDRRAAARRPRYRGCRARTAARARRRALQGAHERVLAPARADDEDLRRHVAQIEAMKSSIGIAGSVS